MAVNFKGLTWSGVNNKDFLETITEFERYMEICQGNMQSRVVRIYLQLMETIWKITQVERSVMHGKKEVKTSAAAEQTVIRRVVPVDVEEESRTLTEPALWTKLRILAFS